MTSNRSGLRSLLLSLAVAMPMIALVALIVLTAPTARAGILVLEDGRAVRFQGELRRKIGVVVFKLEDGTEVSIVERKVDWQATDRVNRITTPPPEETKAPEPPPEIDPPAGEELVGFDSLPEESALRALVHTGRARRGRNHPDIDFAAEHHPERSRGLIKAGLYRLIQAGSLL